MTKGMWNVPSFIIYFHLKFYAYFQNIHVKCTMNMDTDTDIKIEHWTWSNINIHEYRLETHNTIYNWMHMICNPHPHSHPPTLKFRQPLGFHHAAWVELSWIELSLVTTNITNSFKCRSWEFVNGDGDCLMILNVQCSRFSVWFPKS